MFNRAKRYWVPEFKDQLVFWLTTRYGNESRKKFEKMTKKRLMAIYFKIREDLDRQLSKTG